VATAQGGGVFACPARYRNSGCQSGEAVVGPALNENLATMVKVPDLLAEARRRIGDVAEHQPAGSLAVVEVRVPEGVGPEQVTMVFDLVTVAAFSLGALAAFDDDQGHYLLLLPGTPAPATDAVDPVEELGQLLMRLAAVEVACGRHVVRPSAGAGLIALSGHVDPSDSVGEIDVALTTAIGLAHRSIVERALRVHSGAAVRTADRPQPRDARRPWRPWFRRRYLGLSQARKAWVLAGANLVIAWVIPFLIYAALYQFLGLDVSGLGFWVVLGAVVVTALTVYAEAVLALRRVTPPHAALDTYPSASAIVVAYLPNETSTLVETVTCLLGQDYPGPLEVVLAYNTPQRLPIEQDLATMAAADSRLILVRVGDSTSKAQNINAALQVARGEIIGIFDADHRPMTDAFRRAAAWLASGVDVVQGRSVVRNGQANRLARMVAVEFEGIYAVAHPGRAALHTFGIFGGSNGFWRAEVLNGLRMRPDMLTEDIDISIRAVFAGKRIAVDPQLISEELAPLTPMALWSQRIRWSHGWHQVSRHQVRRIWCNQVLTLRQRLGASFLLGWREAYPWVAAQMVPILAFSLLVRPHFHIHWLAPLFLVTTLYVSSVGPVQALFAWRLSVPELRRRRWWWWQYMLLTGILFGEFKALVNRAAHLRELLGDRTWQVTPRTSAGSPGTIARARADGPTSELVAMGAMTGSTASVALDRPLCRIPLLDPGPQIDPIQPAHEH
jgi:cellulose synthase/poly-beta-1,6-N-acetylglucosamine synthase-like glycosyltransferase